MKNKIQISFNQNQFESAVASLQENVVRYRTYLDSVEHITGKREFQTIEQVETFIKAKTTFSNIVLSAGLLDCLDSLKFIQSNYSKINLEVLQINDNVITTKQSVLDQVKEDSTSYLDECFIDEYNTLLKACDALNRLQSPNSSNYLSKDYNSKFKVNVMALQNSNRI
jgi:hypothetical protein